MPTAWARADATAMIPHPRPAAERRTPPSSGDRMAAGAIIAAALDGAWRSLPAAPDLSSEELERVVPRLIRGAAAGPAWRRIIGTPLASTPAGARLRQVYCFQVLEEAILEREIA